MFLDIQGLRCVAVLFVVFFHLWPKLFTTGFLGVDVFFVISGFLMHHILNSKPFTLKSVGIFYRRRISRIVPAYLFTILLTTLGVIAIYTHSEFNKILVELLAASTFTSNIFGLARTDYFNTNAKFRPFLHTWSLSVELQFYLMVPLIFYVYGLAKRSNKNLGICLLCFLMMVSFVFQAVVAQDSNVSHMNILSRIWQFLLGFLSNSWRPVNHEDKQQTSSYKQPDEPKTPQLLDFITPKNIISILLVFQLTISMTNHLWLNRLLCTITTTVFMCLEDKSVFEYKPMVFIGDISYSLYLLHWPAITIYNYMYIKFAEQLTISEGFIIIQVCIILSAFMENLFKKLNKTCTSLRRLTALCLVFYIGIFITCIYLHSIDKTTKKIKLQRSEWEEVIMETSEVFDNRHHIQMTYDEIAVFNQKIHDFSLAFYNKHHIRNRTRTLPSKIFHQIEGTGNLEIVLIGNSISGDLFFGMWARMRTYFKRLTLYFAAAIIPFRADEEGDHPADFIDFIANFDRPIDVLIVRNAHNRIRDNIKYIREEMTGDMNKFYANLSSLGPKHIIIGLAEYESFFHYQQFQKLYEEHGNFNDFNYSLKKAEEDNRLLDRTITSINCSKCHFVDFFSRHCNAIEDRCSVVEESGIINYKDTRHSSLFGSFYVAEQFKKELDRMNIT